MLDENDTWIETLGLIGLYRAGVSLFIPKLRELCGSRDLSSAVADGRLSRRGKLRPLSTYRIQGDHIVISFRKLRNEFDLLYPDAFSSYLLQRHIELNRILRRSFPQYMGCRLREI
jgi:hypothetical protein